MHDVPEDVLEALELVRKDGSCNMFDRNCVIDMVDWYEMSGAYWWLKQHKARYGEALKLMGERRKNRV